ncbi:ubiquinol-cytochrome c reductase iron-sulfur subunit N-terminal domain-containing protein [Hyphomicrobium sp.]|uniref:ubiquinol-cytochrome c reductase iron-sulfur subunit N-terminal domain-containing protein n=1 Tax=Hyphomicrobium sp. TaxID=82 RepID=UPI0034283C32|nr:hypothetical protein [Hyphomicrobium sp.]
MRHRRRLLKIGLALAALVGLGGVAVPFVSSLNPSATAGAGLPRLSIAGLEPGTYRYFVVTEGRDVRDGYLVLRRDDGGIGVFQLRFKGEAVVLPDLHWWSWGNVCINFVPVPMEGRLLPGGTIHCSDTDLGEWSQAEHRWDYFGRNLGSMPDDLYTPKHVIERSEIVIGKSI